MSISDKYIEKYTESRSVLARAGRREEWGGIANGYGVFLRSDENVLELDSGDDYTTL